MNAVRQVEGRQDGWMDGWMVSGLSVCTAAAAAGALLRRRRSPLLVSFRRPRPLRTQWPNESRAKRVSGGAVRDGILSRTSGFVSVKRF